MSYTNGTPFLNLPQTIGSDHRDWFDTNESFLGLDTKVKTLWDDSGSAASAIDALEELTATLQSDLTSLEGTVDTHTSALSTINEALVLINGTLSTLNTSVATKFDSAGIADPYDADHGIYAVGDVVTYNGQRYVCSTAVAAAEPFDADKWTAEDIQTVVNEIKSDLTAKADITDLNNIVKVENVSVTTDSSGWATLGGVTGTHLIVGAYYGGAATTFCEIGSVVISDVQYIGVKVTDGTNPIQGTISLTVISVKKPS